ncbi:hypothetical protein PIB30_022535 [Stylosanthes scabra]|uniref:GRF-type domain-containing protein n=1 Tax=Stylosanthes scabra TaxID=79078 RepID=A0ABU6WAB4_9FABA|nr:hypothetical protein [Stylosanthes scabra]
MSSSQNSRSSHSRTSAIRGEVMCWHGERAVLRTSGTKENPGRRFCGCVRYEVQESCGFFKWADTVQAPTSAAT